MRRELDGLGDGEWLCRKVGGGGCGDRVLSEGVGFFGLEGMGCRRYFLE